VLRRRQLGCRRACRRRRDSFVRHPSRHLVAGSVPTGVKGVEGCTEEEDEGGVGEVVESFAGGVEGDGGSVIDGTNDPGVAVVVVGDDVAVVVGDDEGTVLVDVDGVSEVVDDVSTGFVVGLVVDESGTVVDVVVVVASTEVVEVVFVEVVVVDEVAMVVDVVPPCVVVVGQWYLQPPPSTSPAAVVSATTPMRKATATPTKCGTFFNAPSFDWVESTVVDAKLPD